MGKEKRKANKTREEGGKINKKEGKRAIVRREKGGLKNIV